MATAPTFINSYPRRKVLFHVVVSRKAEELLQEANLLGFDDDDQGDVQDEGRFLRRANAGDILLTGTVTIKLVPAS